MDIVLNARKTHTVARVKLVLITRVSVLLQLATVHAKHARVQMKEDVIRVFLEVTSMKG